MQDFEIPWNLYSDFKTNDSLNTLILEIYNTELFNIYLQQ